MRMPDLSRRTVLATIAIVVGLVVIGVAAFGGSGSSNGGSGSSTNRSVKPVAPIDPDDKDAAKPRKDDADDSFDPFAQSFGASGRRNVTVNVSGNGYVRIWVYYRDRKKPRLLTARTFTETRRVKGRLPLAAVAIQIPGSLSVPGGASRATCTIVIDGTETSQESTTKPWAYTTCIG